MTTVGVVLSGLLVVYHKRLPRQVPIWYTKPWGEEQLADPRWLWSEVGLAVGIGLVAGVSSRRTRDGVLAGMVLASSITAQAILTLGLLRIIILVS